MSRYRTSPFGLTHDHLFTHQLSGAEPAEHMLMWKIGRREDPAIFAEAGSASGARSVEE
jgi:hypothetical protein